MPRSAFHLRTLPTIPSTRPPLPRDASASQAIGTTSFLLENPMTEPTIVPREVYEGLEAAYDHQKGLLVHGEMLHQFLRRNGFEAAARWARDNPISRSRACFHGFKPEDEHGG